MLVSTPHNLESNMTDQVLKHRWNRWELWIAISILLTTTWNSWSQEWCPHPRTYGDILSSTGGSIGPYPTDQAALQAAVNAYHLASNGGTRSTTVVSCNGQGICTSCFSWTPVCNSNFKAWNGVDNYRNVINGSASRNSGSSLILPCDCSMLPASASACTSLLTISLSGSLQTQPTTGSAINNLPFIATVVDKNTGQPPTSTVIVKVSLKVDSKSGGHDHGDHTRPRGGIADVGLCPSDETCKELQTDPNGQVAFNFNAPEAAGTHTITVTCDKCSNSASKSVDVKVDGLEPMPQSILYTFIGQTNQHSDNHYLKPEALNKLWRIALAYQYEQQFKLHDPVTGQFTVIPPPLHVNDASLKWGGLFDISGKWASPHSEHRRGTVIDVRANALPTAIPEGSFKKFKRLATRYGVSALLEAPSIENRHFHLRLLNRKE